MQPNQLLTRQTMDFIEQNPQHHDQRQWHCNSSHFFAGFVEIFASDAAPRQPFVSQNTQRFAREQMQISDDLAGYWFASDRSRSELADLTAAFCGEIDDHRSGWVRRAIAERPDLAAEMIAKLAMDESYYVLAPSHGEPIAPNKLKGVSNDRSN